LTISYRKPEIDGLKSEKHSSQSNVHFLLAIREQYPIFHR